MARLARVVVADVPHHVTQRGNRRLQVVFERRSHPLSRAAARWLGARGCGLPINRIATNSHDEFGIPDTAYGHDVATKGRFRYTGQAWIPELGMYYYKARNYSP